MTTPTHTPKKACNKDGLAYTGKVIKGSRTTQQREEREKNHTDAGGGKAGEVRVELHVGLHDASGDVGATGRVAVRVHLLRHGLEKRALLRGLWREE